MIFRSILWETDDVNIDTLEAPAFFTDLNLDQVIDGIAAGKEDYHLRPFFYAPLHSVQAISYRHEIMKELENPHLLEKIRVFSQQMRAMREHLAQSDKLYYKYQKERWFLDAVEIYCDAVNDLAHDLATTDLNARGFVAFREYLANYANSEGFLSLLSDTKSLQEDLSTVKYCLLIQGNRIRVRGYQSETDYSKEVEETFKKFKQGAVKDYRVTFPDWPEMNHVEARVLELVAELYPGVFSTLDTYYVKHHDYLDKTLESFDREVQVYIAYLEYMAPLKDAGLAFCYPKMSTESKEVYDYGGFDLALAYKLTGENVTVVCNDFYLKGPERILVVTGPNQGGKTTFARTFGQIHYLASLGCPVPGSQAQLFLFDRIFTHFEKEETLKNLSGKLQDDLTRIYDILNRATSNSIIIMNEIFSSTALKDALFLGIKVLEKIAALDALCVCVTFIDEWASLNEKTVSMVSTVVPDNPAVRTYKILRRPADGLSYAISLAEKYGLTYERLKERIRS